MDTLPQRNSLVNQTAEILRTEIGRGAWRDWLPGERALCEKLQVSRNTLRRLMEQSPRPTALLVANPNHYLTVTSRLAQMGWQVPRPSRSSRGTTSRSCPTSFPRRPGT